MYALDISSGRSADLQAIALEKRLPALVSACKRLQFTARRHEDGEDWNAFLHSEQIICVVTWTFCADGLATLYYNQPPHFMVTEISGDLPCHSAFFDETEPPTADGWRFNQPKDYHTVAAHLPRLMADDESPNGRVPSFTAINAQALFCGKCNNRTTCFIERPCL